MLVVSAVARLVAVVPSVAVLVVLIQKVPVIATMNTTLVLLHLSRATVLLEAVVPLVAVK